MKELKNNRQKGITLIALVVTIVVLIILATVSINTVLGDNGIISRAQKARETFQNSQAAEDEAMKQLVNDMAQYDTNGGSSGGGSDTPKDPTKNWDLDKVNKVTSDDNVIVPVPKGYTASTVEGEKSVSSGFVIKEGNDGSKTEEINEFVWVPVSNISDIYDEVNDAGQLWDFGNYNSSQGKFVAKNPVEKRTYSTTSYREPDVVTKASEGSDTTYDAEISNLQQAGLSTSATASDFKTQLQKEFNEMINSVKTYGGFYIGRYETGDLNQAKAVVQKNNKDINNQTWYTMYKLCKTIKANDNVVTSMLWGCQLDATLRWMQTSTNSEVANFPTNSNEKGNYNGILIPTGTKNAYAVNNIYDMAGNVWDWTIEAYSTNCRVVRGGSYGSSASYYPVSRRNYMNPATSDRYYGCRSTLYIK